MSKYNTIGIDLAKNVIQVCVVSPTNKELLSRELTRKNFAEFLGKQKPSLVAFVACVHGTLLVKSRQASWSSNENHSCVGCSTF